MVVTNMEPKKISLTVVIPAYNEAHALPETISAVLEYCKTNHWKLIVVNDGSKDDTRAVLDAAATKWNFLRFYPGLVGGHCIGVDPYYLSYKSELIGYHRYNVLLQDPDKT